jgi:uncharacterized protein YdeI (YjbR/CyaY-like superfamily)
MPLKQLPTDHPIYTFASPKDFEAFLDREHSTAAGCYIKLAKKASGIPSITAAEAVEVCLCFGWIDGGGGGTIDDKWWLTRYTPRRSKSMWSKKNTDTVQRLMKEGMMRPAGLAAVEAAKADGRWDRAYDGPANIVVPEDLAAALSLEPTALAFFDGLSKSERYAVLHRVQIASSKARASRIEALVQVLAAGNVPGRPANSQAMPQVKAGVSKKRGKQSTKKATAVRQDFAKSAPATPIETTTRRPGLRPRG